MNWFWFARQWCWFYWQLHLSLRLGAMGFLPWSTWESFLGFDIRQHSLLSNKHWLYLPKGGNFNEMCLFFFFVYLLDGIKALPRAPWKTNGLPLESIWQRCRRGGNKEMSTWFMCHMIFSTIAGRTKENDSCLSTALYVAFWAVVLSVNERNVSSFSKFFEHSLLCVALCLYLFQPLPLK